MKPIIYWFLVIFFLLLLPWNLWLSGSILRQVHFEAYQLLLILAAIGLSYILIKKTFIPQVTYILFHEISHGIAALLCKGEIYEIKINQDFGYIKSDKNNILIRLAPYSIPLLPFCITLIYLGIQFIITLYQIHYSYQEYLSDVFLVLFCGVLFQTTYYNLYLLKTQTTDVNAKEVILSLLFIINSYLLTTSVLIYVFFAVEPYMLELKKMIVKISL